jgi:hypothetical protein
LGSAWRTVLMKERTGGEVYNLYAHATTVSAAYVVRAAQTGTPLDARGTQLPLNTWTHLAATYDGTTLRLYVNGNQAGTRTAPGPLLTSSGVLRLGGNNIWGEYFKGRLDEIRIYNRALSPAEIQSDLNTSVESGQSDTTPPERADGQPSGVLPTGTTQTTISLTTDENATCRFGASPGVPYVSQPSVFTTTGGASHSAVITGLTNGTSYTRYVRCEDAAGNANPDDFTISFSVAADSTAPVRTNGQPSGALAAGTSQATLSLTTNEPATCRYGVAPGGAYSSLPSVFTTTGGTSHATQVTGLTNGSSYAFAVRCQDAAGNANSDDLVIAFSVAAPPAPDTTAPIVGMTAPPQGATVSGTVSLSANASDNVGVVGVQFLLNGAPLGAEDTTAPFAMTWNSTTVSNGGPYEVSARARDAANNQATATIMSVTVNNAVPSSGLVAAYNFNEGTGTSLTDRTGLGHTGAIAGAAWTTQGRLGSALTFDGVNDWVTIADANDLDFTSGFTVEAWVYPTALGSGAWRTVLLKERPGGEVYNLYAHAGSATAAYVVRAAQSGTPLDARGPQLALNTWTHLAATYDGTTLRLYINGTQVGTRAAAGPLLTSSGVLRLGGNGIWGEYFKGRLDEIRIYNRALSPSEIQADMNTAIQP